MTWLITVTELVRTFGDIIGRVYYKGEEFDIKKGAHMVAHLSPAKCKSGLSMEDLEKVFEISPTLSLEDKDFF